MFVGLIVHSLVFVCCLWLISLLLWWIVSLMLLLWLLVGCVVRLIVLGSVLVIH